jgi:hypothetical protein
MSRDAPIKAEKDFTETLDEQFPQIDLLAKVCFDSSGYVTCVRVATRRRSTY